MHDIRGGPNKRGGQEDFFVYHMKNSGEGEQIFRLLHEKQGECGIFFSEINKRGSPYIRHLRVPPAPS